jgi:hypothetical protein
VQRRSLEAAYGRRVSKKPYLSIPSWVRYRVSSEDPVGCTRLITRGPASFLVLSNEVEGKVEEGAIFFMLKMRKV